MYPRALITPGRHVYRVPVTNLNYQTTNGGVELNTWPAPKVPNGGLWLVDFSSDNEKSSDYKEADTLIESTEEQLVSSTNVASVVVMHHPSRPLVNTTWIGRNLAINNHYRANSLAGRMWIDFGPGGSQSENQRSRPIISCRKITDLFGRQQ